jgi:hypothetical protein
LHETEEKAERLARQYLQDKSHETEEEVDKLAREDKLCKIQKLEDKLHETKKEIDRLAPLVRKFCPDKLREAEEEADRLTRKFLKKIRFNTKTLQLKIESHLSKFTKRYQWFEETYPKIRQDFDEKSNAILRDTGAQLNKVFGSHYHKPIVREIMDQLHAPTHQNVVLKVIDDLNPTVPSHAKQLSMDVQDIQQECITKISDSANSILNTHLERMGALITEVSEKLNSPEIVKNKRTEFDLEVYVVEHLRTQFHGYQIAQSIIFPLTMVARAPHTPDTPGIPYSPGTIEFALVLLIGAITIAYLNAQEIERVQSLIQIQELLTGIVGHANIEVTKILNELAGEITKKMSKIFQNTEEEMNKILIRQPKGLPYQPQSLKEKLTQSNDQAQELLTSIDKKLE